jgi:hypothetical protein
VFGASESELQYSIPSCFFLWNQMVSSVALSCILLRGERTSGQATELPNHHHLLGPYLLAT